MNNSQLGLLLLHISRLASIVENFTCHHIELLLKKTTFVAATHRSYEQKKKKTIHLQHIHYYRIKYFNIHWNLFIR